MEAEMISRQFDGNIIWSYRTGTELRCCEVSRLH